ncbi:hypothetical protein PLESTB_001196000 [Pleodorina starrii]|uniref:Uncharacterized protein n=1 Tax=Pleodorina starrii TaxID=330485 RepID=A0A9W6F663_9CHLO|nr:hypothetical protein PLESTB_001196000 [Pleodorina starrii]
MACALCPSAEKHSFATPTTREQGPDRSMTLGPYVLPGAWALGEGLDLTAMHATPRAVTLKYEHFSTSGSVWSSILDTVVSMFGWEWEFRQNHARKCGPCPASRGDSCSRPRCGSARSSSCGTEPAEMATLSDSDD